MGAEINAIAPLVQTLKVLEGLRKGTNNPAMPVQQVYIFLLVAVRGVVPMPELEEAVGLAQSSISRNVTALGDGRPGEPGYGLIESYEDPDNGRRLLVRLTQQGKAVAWDLLAGG